MMSHPKRRPPSEDRFGPKLLFAKKCRRRKEEEEEDDDDDVLRLPTAVTAFAFRCTHCRQASHDLAPCQCFAAASTSGTTTTSDNSGGTNLCADCDDVGDDMMLYCDACEGRLCSRGRCDYRTCHGCQDVTFCQTCIVTIAAAVVTTCPHCSAMYCGDCSSASGSGHRNQNNNHDDDDEDSSGTSCSSAPSFITTCATCQTTACPACRVIFAPPCDDCGAAVCQDCVTTAVPVEQQHPRVANDRRCRRSCPSCAAAAAAAPTAAAAAAATGRANTGMMTTKVTKDNNSSSNKQSMMMISHSE
jgi:hypothetical protein